MCNIDSAPKDETRIAAIFGARPSDDHWQSIIAPRKPAPAILSGDTGRELTTMLFGLTPVGAKEPDAKRPLNNARWENLNQWPWNLSIGKRCVLPLAESHCIGEMTQGLRLTLHHVMDGSILAVAGLYHVWRQMICSLPR